MVSSGKNTSKEVDMSEDDKMEVGRPTTRAIGADETIRGVNLLRAGQTAGERVDHSDKLVDHSVGIALTPPAAMMTTCRFLTLPHLQHLILNLPLQ